MATYAFKEVTMTILCRSPTIFVSMASRMLIYTSPEKTFRYSNLIDNLDNHLGLMINDLSLIVQSFSLFHTKGNFGVGTNESRESRCQHKSAENSSRGWNSWEQKCENGLPPISLWSNRYEIGRLLFGNKLRWQTGFVWSSFDLYFWSHLLLTLSLSLSLANTFARRQEIHLRQRTLPWLALQFLGLNTL